VSSNGLLKMSELAERSGVSAGTIKHYLREQLLPEPTRTSRNMAYYDASLIPRVRAIKRLQTSLHLPLAVIRQVLDRLDGDETGSDIALEATIARVLGELAPREVVTRKQLLDSGVQAGELALFRSLGVVTPLPGEDGQFSPETFRAALHPR
jgi:DNA-binding transcriptional MerR regulator